MKTRIEQIFEEIDELTTKEQFDFSLMDGDEQAFARDVMARTKEHGFDAALKMLNLNGMVKLINLMGRGKPGHRERVPIPEPFYRGREFQYVDLCPTDIEPEYHHPDNFLKRITAEEAAIFHKTYWRDGSH